MVIVVYCADFCAESFDDIARESRARSTRVKKNRGVQIRCIVHLLPRARREIDGRKLDVEIFCRMKWRGDQATTVFLRVNAAEEDGAGG